MAQGKNGPPNTNPLIGGLTKNTLALVLTGESTGRLGPLTARRVKPAVPFGGKFRIIDFCLSNCINSGIRRVGVITQDRARSLIRHIQLGWGFQSGDFSGFIELLPAQQQFSDGRPLGTADAIRQNLDVLRIHQPRHCLILSGDHIYKMDYAQMLAEHALSQADATVACLEVPINEATAGGVLTVNREGRVTSFAVKPAAPAPVPERPDRALADLGIYVFNADFLQRQLVRDAQTPHSGHDLAGDVIPHAVSLHRVMAHRFAHSCIRSDGANRVPYWRDLGTVDAYWGANRDLVEVIPELNLYDGRWPIWTHQEQLPPAKFVFAHDDRWGMAVNSLVSGGCIVSGATVRRSLLFSNVRVEGARTLVEDSVILPDVRVDHDARLRRAVVDTGTSIPPGLVVGEDPEEDARRFYRTPGGTVLITPAMLG